MIRQPVLGLRPPRLEILLVLWQSSGLIRLIAWSIESPMHLMKRLIALPLIARRLRAQWSPRILRWLHDRWPKLVDAPPQLDRLLLFVGSPRTGSTILGQLINYHPECLVATEARVTTRVLVNGHSLEETLADARAQALSQFETGLEQDDKFSQTLGRYQPRWIPMHDLARDAAFAKQQIRVLGDKKAGGTTEAYLAAPAPFEAFLDEHRNTVLLQIIRHPIDAAVSYVKSHEVASFEEACEKIVMQSHVAYTLGQRYGQRFHTVYYEDLLAEPASVLRSIFGWLGLSVTEHWLRRISTKVNSPRPRSHLPEQVAIARQCWERHSKGEELARYFAD